MPHPSSFLCLDYPRLEQPPFSLSESKLHDLRWGGGDCLTTYYTKFSTKSLLNPPHTAASKCMEPISPELLQTFTVHINLLLVDFPLCWLRVQLIPICQVSSYISIQFSVSKILLTQHVLSDSLLLSSSVFIGPCPFFYFTILLAGWEGSRNKHMCSVCYVYLKVLQYTVREQWNFEEYQKKLLVDFHLLFCGVL